MGKAGNALLSFAAGAASGYVGARDKARRETIEDEDRARTRELQDIQLRHARQAESDQLALRDAGAPAVADVANDVLKDDDGNDMPAVGRNRVTQGNSVQRFDTPEAAQVALSQANAPEARAQRIGDTLAAQGKPVEAMKFQSEALEHADRLWTRKLRETIPQGHAGLAELMTGAEGGVFKGKQVVPVPSEDGKTITYAVKNPDGSMAPTPYKFANDQNGVIRAAYMLSRINPETKYRNMVEEDRKAHEQERKDKELQLRERTLDEVKIPLADARVAAAEARAAAAGGSGKVDAEERKRYTALFGEAGRRMDDANKTLRQLQANPAFMVNARRPGTPEAQQLADIQADLATYKSDRDLYSGLLGGDKAREARAAKGGDKPAVVDRLEQNVRTKGGSTAAIAQPQSKAEYDALPPGAKYRHPDGDVRIKGGKPTK